MRRQNFPSILLYSLGLALALSLAFNGFLLREQTRIQRCCESAFDDAPPVNPEADQRRLSDGSRGDTLLAGWGKLPTHPRLTPL